MADTQIQVIKAGSLQAALDALSTAKTETEAVSTQAAELIADLNDAGDYALAQGDYALTQGQAVNTRVSNVETSAKARGTYNAFKGYRAGTGVFEHVGGGSTPTYSNNDNSGPLPASQVAKLVNFAITGASSTASFAFRANIDATSYPGTAPTRIGWWAKKSAIVAYGKPVDLAIWHMSAANATLAIWDTPQMSAADATTVGKFVTNDFGTWTVVAELDGWVFWEFAPTAAPPASTAYTWAHPRFNNTTGASTTVQFMSPIGASGSSKLSPFAVYPENIYEYDPTGQLKTASELAASSVNSSTAVVTLKQLNLHVGYDTGAGTVEHTQNVTFSSPVHDGTGPVKAATRRLRMRYGAAGTSTSHLAIVALNNGTFTPGNKFVDEFYLRKADLAAMTAAGMQFQAYILGADNTTVRLNITTATVTKANLQVAGTTTTPAAVSGITMTFTVVAEEDGWMRCRITLSDMPTGGDNAKVRIYFRVMSPTAAGDLDILDPIALTGPNAVSVDRTLQYAQTARELEVQGRLRRAELLIASLTLALTPAGSVMVNAGDSWTAGVSDGATNASTAFGKLFGDARGFTTINKGISGSTMTDIAGAGSNNPMVLRNAVDVVSSNPALVTYMFGYNDFEKHAPLGDLRTLNNTQQFYGAYYTTVKATLDGTAATVHILIPPYWNASEFFRDAATGLDTSPRRNNQGWTLEQYRQAARDVGAYLALLYPGRVFVHDMSRDLKDFMVYNAIMSQPSAYLDVGGYGKHLSQTLGNGLLRDYIFARIR